MIEMLYVKNEKAMDKNKEKKQDQTIVNLNESKTRLYRQKILDCCSKACLQRLLCFKICQLSREERLFAKARYDLDNEIDIIKFLKKIRRFEAF